MLMLRQATVRRYANQIVFSCLQLVVLAMHGAIPMAILHLTKTLLLQTPTSICPTFIPLPLPMPTVVQTPHLQW